MKMLSVFIAVISLLIFSGNLSAATEKATLTKQEIEKIKQASRIGREMYQKDIRAARASDLVIGAINAKAYPDFVGWVTHYKGMRYVVSFYEKKGEAYSVFADVEFDKKDKASVNINPGRVVDEEEASMIRARVSAILAGRNGCSKRFNTIVMKSSNPDAWDVYVLAATTEHDIVSAGGHSRITVGKKSGEVIQRYNFTKSCLNLDKSPDDMPVGAKIAALTLTHIVEDLPAETHVYMNLLHDIPFYIATDKGMWNIENGIIRYEGKLN